MTAVAPDRAGGATLLEYAEADALLRSVGIKTAHARTAWAVAELLDHADELGYPVVLKAGGLVHKTDGGGVVLGLTGPAETEQAALALAARLGDKALPYVVQRQYAGVEVLVGLRRAGGLGASVVVGFGGVMTELVSDVARGAVPVDEQAARAMLERLKLWPLLAGYRGAAAADVAALQQAIVAVSELAEKHDELVELDLNPLLVGEAGQGVVAVDIRAAVDVPVARRPRRPGGLLRLLAPEHVVVVGVSDDPGKTGSQIFDSIRRHHFTGRLDAVHPAGGTYNGARRYESLADVPGSPDLVCLAVPAPAVPDLAAQAVAKGAGGLIVHTAGFSEAGEAGAALEAEMAAAVAGSEVRVMGPNCMGLVGPQLAASMSGVLTRLEQRTGGVALVTSSGALGSCLMSRLWVRGTGTSYVVSLGNASDIDAADVLAALAGDEATRVVGLVVEGISDGPTLAAAVRACAQAGKPVIAYCLGRSEAGAEAAMSHTGSLVQLYDLRVDLLESAGAAVTRSLETLEDALALAAGTPLPAGESLCVVCTSGGAATVIADGCQDHGLTLAPVGLELRARLESIIPAFGTVGNPMDVTASAVTSPAIIGEVLDAVFADGGFDAVAVQFTTNADPSAGRMAEELLSRMKTATIPVYVSRYGPEALAPEALGMYRDAGVPVLAGPERVAAAAALVARASAALERSR